MSDVPTASTSTASTSTASSSASTSQTNPYMFRLANQDIDCTTTDESELSSNDETDSPDEESNNSIEIICAYDESDDNMDNTSWSSSSSTTESCGNVSTSDISDTEKSILREMIRETWSNKSTENDLSIRNSTSILILIQQPYETEDQLDEIGINLINVEEHTKRLRDLEKEMDYIESTEWMFRPIDSSIR